MFSRRELLVGKSHFLLSDMMMATLLSVCLLVFPVEALAQDMYELGHGVNGAGGASVSHADLPLQSSTNDLEAEAKVPPRGYQYPEALRSSKLNPSLPDGPQKLGVDDLSTLDQDPAPADTGLIHSFEGFTVADTMSIPGDPVMAAGPQNVILMVNTSIRVADKTGVTQSTSTFSDWWASVLPSDAITFDPKVLYDQHNNRWVMLALALVITESTQESYYLLSTSYTSDANGQWCVWSLDATVDNTNPSSNWADFPGLGVDSQAVYITSNQFAFDDGQFQYAKIRILGKEQLYNNTCGNVSWWDFWDVENEDGTKAFTIQPAHTYGTPGIEYLINSRPDAGNFLTLWELSNPLAMRPTLNRFTVSVGSYSIPPNAQQRDGGVPLDTGDARLLAALWRDGSIYTAQTIAWTDGVSRAAYTQIQTSDRTLVTDVAFGADDFFYYYPAFTVANNSDLVTVFNRSATSEYVGIRYTSLPAGGPFAGSALLREGEANYVLLDGNSLNRWGDYNGAALDPVSGSVWIYSMYAGQNNTWRSRVGEVMP